MNRIKKVVATFDELIRNYYGSSGTIELRPIDRFDEMVANYYGKPFSATKGCEKSAPAVSMSADNGEVLRQLTNGKYEEYIVQSSMEASEFEEYIVERAGALASASLSLISSEAAAAECGVDVLQPSGNTAPEAVAPLQNRQPSEQPRPIAAPAAESPKTMSMSAASGTKATSKAKDDEFAADLQAILTGQKVYDPHAKKMVARDEFDQEPNPPVPDGDNSRAAQDTSARHKIFDQIAQSMEYANAYDLGTVELQKRFGEFDKSYSLQQKAKSSKNVRPPTQVEATALAKRDTEDFVCDLDAIQKKRSASQTEQSFSIDAGARYSKPLFDTGEHVLIAADLYEDRLRVGQNPGVPFSYGQIIAMGDFYSSVDQMMSDSVSNLQTIKTLIRRSTDFYRTGKNNRQLDVSNKEWNDATNGRYLELAEDNYEHFSANYFFPNAAFAGSLNRHGTNKSAWESHHRRAIEEAQRASLANSNSSVFLEYPLIINAFGDHFLTDAFAAGHVINKEEMIACFQENFFNGRSLKSSAEEFFKKLARQAFRGEVARKFSHLETTDYPVCIGPLCLPWHPNINSEDRFHKMLLQAAKTQPEGITNLAVKALHDRLNHDGLEVFNDAGDGTWTITGDAYLNDHNRAVIRKAVQQSADNINDPSILQSNLNFDGYFAKVWRYVPRLTEASWRRVLDLTNDYLTPTSEELVKTAAEIITSQLDMLIEKLIKENKLKAA